jgi:vancomycin permeability regulator SanA
MTRAVLTARVENIKRLAYRDQDDEAAHRAEDKLREDVLQAIFDGEIAGSRAREFAGIALSTNGIDFGRWCA